MIFVACFYSRHAAFALEMATTPLVAAMAEVSTDNQFGILFLPKFLAKSKTIFSHFRPHYLRVAKVSTAVL